MAVVGAAAVMALTACDDGESASQDSGSEGGSAPSESSAQAELPQTITLLRTGSSDTAELKVESDGAWDYRHKKNGDHETGQLSADELASLAGFEEDPNLSDWGGLEQEPEDTSKCGDVPIYVLHVGETTVKNNGCGDDPNDAYTDIVELLGEATPI